MSVGIVLIEIGHFKPFSHISSFFSRLKNGLKLRNYRKLNGTSPFSHHILP